MSGRGRTPKMLGFFSDLALETIILTAQARQKMGIKLSESEANELMSAMAVLAERKNQRGP